MKKKFTTGGILLLLFPVLLVSCAKINERGYGPNDCRVCRAYYDSAENYAAGSPVTVCDERGEQSFRQEYNYANHVTCKKQ